MSLIFTFVSVSEMLRMRWDDKVDKENGKLLMCVV